MLPIFSLNSAILLGFCFNVSILDKKILIGNIFGVRGELKLYRLRVLVDTYFLLEFKQEINIESNKHWHRQNPRLNTGSEKPGS